MKSIFTVLVGATCMLPASNILSQATNGKVANFGIDGDVLSNYNLAGSWDATASHDWFKNASTSAAGIIDTTGASAVYNRLLAGENLVFDRGMSIPRYSILDGYVVLDARYARDYFGFSSSGSNTDLTTFTSGSKNGMAPSTFSTNPGGASVLDKCDIIDAYVHMRRNGNVVNGSSSSHLIAMMAASTFSNNGNRFFDVEFYCSDITYNTTTGVFSNSGPAATGGHTAWVFNPDGSIQSFGDMDAAFSFSGNSFTELSLWVWVSLSDYSSILPKGFDFVPGNFSGATPGAVYGYAKIQAKAGSSMQVWGAVNSYETSGPLWGTTSGTLGSASNNYHYRNYDAGEIGEAAVDLTSLGIDPAAVAGQNPCNPPFKRVLVKSRSSSSFTAALQDFAGPYSFLDAPVPSASIVSPAVLNCNTSTISLAPQNILAGSNYYWSTSNGNIVSSAESTYVTINKPGKYYLKASVYPGCPSTVDSIEVLIDTLKPVATAKVNGLLYSVPLSTVTLLGGDPVASNVMTPFGGSEGLSYSWTGPSGFTSTIQNPTTSTEGYYTITVTELRNGCTNRAALTLSKVAAAPLPVKIMSFQGDLENNKVTLTWAVADNEIAYRFDVERSVDGKNFTTAGVVFSSEKKGKADYRFVDQFNSSGTSFYRLKMYDKSQAINYSNILALEFKTTADEIRLVNNPVNDKIDFTFQSTGNRPVVLKVIDMNGRVLINKTFNVFKGSNSVSLPISASFTQGVYMIDISQGNERVVSKFLKR